jgi:diguanylate cyclase (GGDEF)-like protein
MFNESGKQDILKVVERIVSKMASTPFDFEDKSIATTLSAGVAGYPDDGVDVRTIMAQADEAMYVSKRTGKNRLTVFSENMYGESFGKHEDNPHHAD